ncbi:MAG TPA: hypothetical protein VNT32_02690 [Thermoleophilaceae bacterium]|nr:hypothetical protein [Thermoleophilaceae bacterium]
MRRGNRARLAVCAGVAALAAPAAAVQEIHEPGTPVPEPPPPSAPDASWSSPYGPCNLAATGSECNVYQQMSGPTSRAEAVTGRGSWYSNRNNYDYLFLAASTVNQGTSGTTWTQTVDFKGSVLNPCGKWVWVERTVPAEVVFSPVGRSLSSSVAVPPKVGFKFTTSLASTGCSTATLIAEGEVIAPYYRVPPGAASPGYPSGGAYVETNGGSTSHVKFTWGTKDTRWYTTENQSSAIVTQVSYSL